MAMACCLILIQASLLAPCAFGQTLNVGSTSDLQNAILLMNSANGTYTLNITNNFSLNQQVHDITGNSNITINGNGHTIDGANSYLPFTIDGGTVTLQSLNMTNSGGPLTLTGGTLIDATGSLPGAVTDNGLVKFNNSSSETYAGAISGTGQVEFSGSGPVTLTGLNSYTGGTTIDHGAEVSGTTDSLKGSITNNYLLQFNNATTGTFAGSISGAGTVYISGAAVTFTGDNSYTGGTVIGNHSVLIGNTTSIQGYVINLGVLDFNQSTNGTYAGNLSGSGMLEINGGGTVTLTGLNTSTGSIQVDSGSKLIGSTSSLSGNITNNGALQFNQSTTGTYSGNMSGSGAFEFGGGGHITLTGISNYTGGTILDTGTTLTGTTDNLQGAITNNGAIQFNQTTSGSYAGIMSGSGSVEISGTGTVNFSGNNTYTGGTLIDQGSTLNMKATAIQGGVTNNGLLQFNSSSGTFAGNISGTGAIEVLANKSVTLTGFNTYSGGTTVDSNGSLIGSTGSVRGDILNNGFVNFQSLTAPSGPYFTPDVLWVGGPISPSYPAYENVYSGTMTGTGRVEISGSGTTIFMNTNSYTGGTTVDSGATLIGNTTTLQGNITNNGMVVFNSNLGLAAPGTNLPVMTPFAIADSSLLPLPTVIFGNYSGNMSGSGSVEIAGNQTVMFSGTNTYTGGTTVNAFNTLIGTTSSLQGAFTNMGVVVFDQSTNGAYSGNMEGSGGVQIGGTGKVTFSGTNTYTGGTNIAAGSTLIGTTHSLQGNIVDNGMLQFNQSSSGTFAGVISGTGGVEINGLGPITFSGANTYTGGTTIDNGSTLIVGPQGSILGTTTINNGGNLQGQGSIGSLNVNSGGTITPGTVNAPLTIHGNFHQNSGSTYSAEISPTASDTINVTGTAQIGTGTTLNLTFDSGTYTVGSKYTLLSAAGGLTGSYTSTVAPTLTQNLMFYESYDANKLQLVVGSNLANNSFSLNQYNMATVLDAASYTATGSFANAITQLTILDAPSLSNAMNQLTGDIYPSLGTVVRQTSTAQMQILSSRLASLIGPASPKVASLQSPNGIRLVSRQASDTPAVSGSPASSPVDGQNWSTWAQGYGLGGNVTGDGNAGGTNYQLGGTLFGVERWLGDNLMVGVLGGYAGTSVHESQSGASAQINTYQAGLYELFREDLIYVSNIDAFSNNAFDVSRPINFGTVHGTASSNTSGNQWSHYTEAGTSHSFDDLKLQPFVGLQYLYLDQPGVNESGANSLDLTTQSEALRSFRGSLGARVAQEMMWGNTLVVPSLAARYQHEFGNGSQIFTSSFAGAPTVQFATSGNRTGRNFGLVTLAATAYLTDNFSLYGMVDTQFSTNFFGLVGSGGLQYSW